MQDEQVVTQAGLATKAETIMATVNQSEKEKKVIIDGKEYTIKKLKFGGQIKLAKVMGELIKGLKYESKEDTNSLEDKKGGSVSFDIGTILALAPDKMIPIMAVGLGITEQEVENFEDSTAALQSLEEIINMNDMRAILGKSMTLLQNMGI